MNKNDHIKATFADRERTVDQLARKRQLRVSDVQGLDRITRKLVIAELWGRCTAAARQALLCEREPLASKHAKGSG